MRFDDGYGEVSMWRDRSAPVNAIRLEAEDHPRGGYARKLVARLIRRREPTDLKVMEHNVTIWMPVFSLLGTKRFG